MGGVMSSWVEFQVNFFNLKKKKSLPADYWLLVLSEAFQLHILCSSKNIPPINDAEDMNIFLEEIEKVIYGTVRCAEVVSAEAWKRTPSY